MIFFQKTNSFFFYIALAVCLLCVGCAPKHKRIPVEPGVHYSGYSAGFQEIRHYLSNGGDAVVLEKLDTIDKEMHKKHQYDDSFAENMGMLPLLENTSLYLHLGRVDKALEYSRYADCLLEKRNNESYASSFLRGTGSVLGPVFGVEGEYSPLGYEKVMLLNIEAMNYLLKGDDRAFNVARKSTDWQEEERGKFEKTIKGIEAAKSPETKDKDTPQNHEIKNRVIRRLVKEFKQYDKKALKVKSAFVNPFGDYLAGAVQEFKSVGSLKSMMSNALIQYKNAKKLNPKCRLLKLAVKDMKKKRSADHLIQLVAFDGLAPEKKILSFNIQLKKSKVPIHLEVPIYDPVKSKVKKITVATTGGRVLATFHPLADIDALALRHQKDSLPGLQALAVVSAIRDVAINTVNVSVSESINKHFKGTGNVGKSLQGIWGGLMANLDDCLEPDTSAWMSMPKKILAARFHPPRHLKTIVITSYDSKGKRLSRKKIKLGKGSRHFIFVRTLNKQMKVIPGKEIWSPKERLERIDC